MFGKTEQVKELTYQFRKFTQDKVKKFTVLIYILLNLNFITNTLLV